MLCTEKLDKTACYGDQGGPLMITSGDGVTPGQNYDLIGNIIWYHRMKL